MALTADALCTLADVKAMLGITDISQDVRLEMLINSTSAMIARYCDRIFTRGTYSSEAYTGTNRQLLVLRQWPVVSVSLVTVNGDTLSSSLYELKMKDQSMGVLYKADGWIMPTTYVTGLTLDTWATGRDYAVTYIAGYYMPTDTTHYTVGGSDSLPLDLSDICMQIVIERNERMRNGATGLTQISEGGLTYVWGASTTNINQDSGISSYVMGALNKYKRRFVS